MKDLPLVSIITVVYNGQHLLNYTINSVIEQTYSNIEYIIIDGGSTDDTLQIISNYKHRITYWVSEKDKGIFDAMNKGLKKATGDWIIFMNAGDGFHNNEVLHNIFNRPITQSTEMIYGNVCLYDKEDLYTVKTKTNKVKINLNAICHQSVFIKRVLHQQFNLNYKLAADHDLIYKFIKNGKCLYIDLTVSNILMGGVSSDLTATRNEKFKISWANGSKLDVIFASLFFVYGAVKEYFKKILLLLFPPKVFSFIRSIKNKMEQF